MRLGKFARHILGLSFFLILAFTVQAGFCGYTADCDQAPTWETGSWTKNDCLKFETANDNAAEPATPGKISNSAACDCAASPIRGVLACRPCQHGKTQWRQDNLGRNSRESRASVWPRLWTSRLTWTGIIRVCSGDKTRAESITRRAVRRCPS